LWEIIYKWRFSIAMFDYWRVFFVVAKVRFRLDTRRMRGCIKTEKKVCHWRDVLS